jgi:hypothetical protein
MDQETWRTLITAAAVIGAGIVPAGLLFLQNRSNNQRALEERRELRQIEADRDAQQAADNRAALDLDLAERQRQRYQRFARIVEQIATATWSRDDLNTGACYSLPDADRVELADAYHAVLLWAEGPRDDVVVRRTQEVRQALEELIDFAQQHTGPSPTLVDAVGDALEEFRVACRNTL